MKKIFIILTIMATISCTHNTTYKNCDTETFAKEIMKSNVQLLDVRTSTEHQEGNISGSINIDINKENFREQVTTLLNKEDIIAVYCRSGRRSKKASQALTEAGYKVIELDKGYNSWIERKGNLVNEATALLNRYKRVIKDTKKEEYKELLTEFLQSWDNLCKKYPDEANIPLGSNKENPKELEYIKETAENIVTTLIMQQ